LIYDTYSDTLVLVFIHVSLEDTSLDKVLQVLIGKVNTRLIKGVGATAISISQSVRLAVLDLIHFGYHGRLYSDTLFVLPATRDQWLVWYIQTVFLITFPFAH
jgi:hypothetical protein